MLHLFVAGEYFSRWFTAEDVPDGLQRVIECGGDTHAPTARAMGPGVFSALGEVAIVLPRCFKSVSEPAARLGAAGHTLRVLRRYLAEEPTRRAVVETDLRIAAATSGDTSSLFEQIEAALLLWNDYQSFGPLPIATRQLSSDSRGRIHWPRTIAGTVPLVSGCDVLYPDAVRSRHALEVEHPITRLHAITAEAAGSFLGARGSRSSPRIPPSREALSVLDRHERTLFQDRHRQVASLLRRCYAPSSRTVAGASREAVGVIAPSFPHVWERILFVALGSRELPVLPDGRYSRAGKDERQHATRFLLDLFVEALHQGERVQLVLDAKDYDLGSLPMGEDVRKQILYRLLLSDRFGVASERKEHLAIERIGNAFLLPAALDGVSGIRIQAVHDLAGEEETIAPLGRIVALEVDFARVATAYSRGTCDHVLKAAVVKKVMDAMRKGSALLAAEVR